MNHWKTTLGAAGVALALNVSFARDALLHATTPPGWTSSGAVAGRDAVRAERSPATGGLSALVLQKTSTHAQAARLSVFQNIDARTWRGQAMQFSGQILATSGFVGQQGASDDVAIEVRIQCEKGAKGIGSARFSHFALPREWVDVEVETNVPDDGDECAFGLSTDHPSTILLRSVKLRRLAAKPPAPLPLDVPTATPVWRRLPVTTQVGAPVNLDFSR